MMSKVLHLASSLLMKWNKTFQKFPLDSISTISCASLNFSKFFYSNTYQNWLWVSVVIIIYLVLSSSLIVTYSIIDCGFSIMPVWLLDQAFALLHIHTLIELFYVFNICGSRVTTTILMLIHILIILFVVKTILIIMYRVIQRWH